MSSKEHLSAVEGQAVSSLKEIHHRSREILQTMARTSALIAALVAPNVFAAPCSAGREDFINYVTGGNECLALEVLRGEALKKPGSHLVVLVHGDSNDRLIRKGALNRNILQDNIPEDSKDVAAIQIIRPGYKTDYNNAIPEGYPFPYEAGKYAVRYSTGFVQDGVDSYTKRNIKSVMDAAARLKAHYESKTLTMTGQSGGAAVILAGSAQYHPAPDALILTGGPCNLEKLEAYHNAPPPPPSSISPHTVIHQMPKDIKIVVVNGVNDNNTPPHLMQECVDILKGVGADVTFLQPFAGHDVAKTPEFQAVLGATLELEPRTIVATKPSSPSSGLISTSAQVPAK